MDPNLTNSAIQLAILKIVTENNAMLKTILHVLADMRSSMAISELSDDTRQQFQDNYTKIFEKMAQAHEAVSLERAFEYAKNMA